MMRELGKERSWEVVEGGEVQEEERAQRVEWREEEREPRKVGSWCGFD